jgi:hypothetical protein
MGADQPCPPPKNLVHVEGFKRAFPEIAEKCKCAHKKDHSMARKSFADEQIMSALRLADSGVPIVEVCRVTGM